MKFQDRMAELMNGAGLKETADAIGITPEGLYKITKLGQEPRLLTIRKIAKHYNLTISELMKGVE